MSEQIIAEPISGRAEHSLEEVSQKEVGIGTEGGKRYLEVKVGNSEARFFERPYSKEVVRIWKIFRDLGLPVVPTLRKTSRETLLMTDVTADGSRVYGKGFYGLLNGENKGIITKNFTHNPEMDNLFLKITNPIRFHLIKKKIEQYLKIAKDNFLIFPSDDPLEIVVHPDGSWDLMMLDLYLGKAATEDEKNKYSPEEIDKANRRILEYYFFPVIEWIRSELLERRRKAFAKKLKAVFLGEKQPN